MEIPVVMPIEDGQPSPPQQRKRHYVLRCSKCRFMNRRNKLRLEQHFHKKHSQDTEKAIILYLCKDCYNSFETSSNYEYHYEVMHRMHQQVFPCEMGCEEKFVCVADAIRHRSKHLRNNQNARPSTRISNTEILTTRITRISTSDNQPPKSSAKIFSASFETFSKTNIQETSNTTQKIHDSENNITEIAVSANEFCGNPNSKQMNLQTCKPMDLSEKSGSSNSLLSTLSNISDSPNFFSTKSLSSDDNSGDDDIIFLCETPSKAGTSMTALNLSLIKKGNEIRELNKNDIEGNGINLEILNPIQCNLTSPDEEKVSNSSSKADFENLQVIANNSEKIDASMPAQQFQISNNRKDLDGDELRSRNTTKFIQQTEPQPIEGKKIETIHSQNRPNKHNYGYRNYALKSRYREPCQKAGRERGENYRNWSAKGRSNGRSRDYDFDRYAHKTESQNNSTQKRKYDYYEKDASCSKRNKEDAQDSPRNSHIHSHTYIENSTENRKEFQKTALADPEFETLSLTCTFSNCSREVANENELVDHLENNHKTKRNKCKTTGCTFSSQYIDQLEAHYTKDHSNSSRIFTCNGCKIKDFDVKGLVDHTFRKHEYGKFKCTKVSCAKIFPTRHDASKHYSEHHR